MKQHLSSQDLLFLSVQLLTKQKLFGFAKLSLPGFEIFHSSKISTLLSAFFHLQASVQKKSANFSEHQILFKMQTCTWLQFIPLAFF